MHGTHKQPLQANTLLHGKHECDVAAPVTDKRAPFVHHARTDLQRIKECDSGSTTESNSAQGGMALELCLNCTESPDTPKRCVSRGSATVDLTKFAL